MNHYFFDMSHLLEEGTQADLEIIRRVNNTPDISIDDLQEKVSAAAKEVIRKREEENDLGLEKRQRLSQYLGKLLPLVFKDASFVQGVMIESQQHDEAYGERYAVVLRAVVDEVLSLLQLSDDSEKHEVKTVLATSRTLRRLLKAFFHVSPGMEDEDVLGDQGAEVDASSLADHSSGDTSTDTAEISPDALGGLDEKAFERALEGLETPVVDVLRMAYATRRTMDDIDYLSDPVTYASRMKQQGKDVQFKQETIALYRVFDSAKRVKIAADFFDEHPELSFLKPYCEGLQQYVQLLADHYTATNKGGAVEKQIQRVKGKKRHTEYKLAKYRVPKLYRGNFEVLWLL